MKKTPGLSERCGHARLEAELVVRKKEREDVCRSSSWALLV
jgi:hypothetical protein